MAFATTNLSRESAGSYNVMRGTWTGTAGDDVGTVAGGGYALGAEFDTNLSSGPSEAIIPRITNSGNSWTVTVPYHQTVTAGSFAIRFK
jgi:hypothetical protein